MCIAWIRNKRLHRAWPVAGFAFGMASFFGWFLIANELLEAFDSGEATESSEAFLSYLIFSATVDILLVQLLLVSPCVVLAIKLVIYHFGKLGSPEHAAIGPRSR